MLYIKFSKTTTYCPPMLSLTSIIYNIRVMPFTSDDDNNRVFKPANNNNGVILLVDNNNGVLMQKTTKMVFLIENDKNGVDFVLRFTIIKFR